MISLCYTLALVVYFKYSNNKEPILFVLYLIIGLLDMIIIGSLIDKL